METQGKKAYIEKLAKFLSTHKMVMSGEELADHLNRNKILTSYGAEYQGGRGIYTLIKATYNSLKNLDLDEGASHVAKAFVKPDGSYAYE